jgi:hypothetical protein
MMSVLVDKNTRLIVQGIVGHRELRLKGVRIRSCVDGVAGPSTAQLASARVASLRMTEFGSLKEKHTSGLKPASGAR